MGVIPILLNYTIKLLLGVGCLAFFINFKKLSLSWKLIGFQLLAALLTEVIASLMLRYNYEQTSIVYNPYIFIEEALLSLAVIYFIKKKNFRLRFGIFGGFILCVGLWGWEIYSDGITLWANTSFLCSCIFLSTAYIILMIYYSIKTPGGVIDSPVFWLCLGHILYFSCNIPLFAMMDTLSTTNNKLLGEQLYNIPILLAIMRYSLVVSSLFYFIHLEKIKTIIKQA